MRLPVLFGTALLLCACSPLARLEFRLLTRLVPLDVTRLQLSASKSCPPAPLPALPPSAPVADAEWQQVEVSKAGFEVVLGFRGARCSVSVTGFYDTNADRKVNSGDLFGATRTLLVEDRGLFRGNLTKGPDVLLHPVK